MGSTIIGIDHGYKNMKSANAMFATRLSRLDSKPDEMQMDGVVEFEQQRAGIVSRLQGADDWRTFELLAVLDGFLAAQG